MYPGIKLEAQVRVVTDAVLSRDLSDAALRLFALDKYAVLDAELLNRYSFDDFLVKVIQSLANIALRDSTY